MKKLLLILAATAACMAFVNRAQAQVNYIVDCMGQFFLDEYYSGDMSGEEVELYFNGSYNSELYPDVPLLMLESMLYSWSVQPQMRYIISTMGYFPTNYTTAPSGAPAHLFIRLYIHDAAPVGMPYTPMANITFVNQHDNRPDRTIRNYP